MISCAAVSKRLFRLICFSSSLIMLFMSLLARVQLMDVEQTILDIEKEMELCAEEQELLKLRHENSLSLEEIEKLAVERLGMQRPGARQIYYLDQYD